jgi:hypothetical protein
VNSTGVPVTLNFGDSTSGTVFASGVIAFDTAAVAGVAMTDQAFLLVNDTDNVATVGQDKAAGIFGLGFPPGRYV